MKFYTMDLAFEIVQEKNNTYLIINEKNNKNKKKIFNINDKIIEFRNFMCENK